MIPISNFFNPDHDSYEYHAMQKATKELPRVIHIGDVENYSYYQVTSSRKLGPKYVVTMIWDRQAAEHTVECNCAAGHPPANVHNGVIEWSPRVCYHVASALLFASNQGKDISENNTLLSEENKL